MKLEGRKAIVTGGAKGMGAAITLTLAREGADLVLTARDTDALDEVAAQVRALGRRAEVVAADVTDEAQVAAMAEQAKAFFGGRIDILVNNAGIAGPTASVADYPVDEWRRVLDIDLDGVFHGCKAVAPVMVEQGYGRIVNIASIAGRGVSIASSSAYAAAKGGIIALTKKLSLELGPHGINVNAIAPSRTLTERIRPRFERLSAEQRAAEVANVPLRRLPDAMDQARVVCFLASADADYVTGVTIDVTGGHSIGLLVVRGDRILVLNGKYARAIIQKQSVRLSNVGSIAIIIMVPAAIVALNDINVAVAIDVDSQQRDSGMQSV